MIEISATHGAESTVEPSESPELMRDNQSRPVVDKSSLFGFVSDRGFALEEMRARQIGGLNDDITSAVDIAAEILNGIGYRFGNGVKHSESARSQRTKSASLEPPTQPLLPSQDRPSARRDLIAYGIV